MFVQINNKHYINIRTLLIKNTFETTQDKNENARTEKKTIQKETINIQIL